MPKRAWISPVLVPVLATVVGLVVGTIFIILLGKSPIVAYGAFAQAVIGEPRMFGETLVATVPLIFTGLAVSLAFRCGLFNIGAEGQYLVASAAAAWAGYRFTLPGPVHPAVALLSGALAGALWASVSGMLKAYRGVHEVINSIMLNYIGLFFTHWLLMNHLRPKTATSSSTPAVQPTAALAQGLIEGSRLHWGLWIALGTAVIVWIFLWKTAAGYEIRAVGLSSGAAEYAGISVSRNIILAMALSGALAGLAGGVQVLGVNRRFFEPLSFAGYGFEGIAVALVGRNHPLGVVLSALLFGALGRGGSNMQAVAGVPKAVVAVVQGTVIFFVAAEGIWRFWTGRRWKTRAEVKPL